MTGARAAAVLIWFAADLDAADIIVEEGVEEVDEDKEVELGGETGVAVVGTEECPGVLFETVLMVTNPSEDKVGD